MNSEEFLRSKFREKPKDWRLALSAKQLKEVSKASIDDKTFNSIMSHIFKETTEAAAKGCTELEVYIDAVPISPEMNAKVLDELAYRGFAVSTSSFDCRKLTLSWRDADLWWPAPEQ